MKYQKQMMRKEGLERGRETEKYRITDFSFDYKEKEIFTQRKKKNGGFPYPEEQ